MQVYMDIYETIKETSKSMVIHYFKSLETPSLFRFIDKLHILAKRSKLMSPGLSELKLLHIHLKAVTLFNLEGHILPVPLRIREE